MEEEGSKKKQGKDHEIMEIEGKRILTSTKLESRK
jgi:hypothetical protein